MKRYCLLLLVFSVVTGVGCLSDRAGEGTIPTPVPALASMEVSPPPAGSAALPATWTPSAATIAAMSAVPYASPTMAPTRTPWPASPTPSPTSTAAPSPSATATYPPTVIPLPSVTPPAGGTNLLPNGSFEGGWYHIDGIPELQVAEQWRLTWREGENSLDPDPWNAWVRPESRVLPRDFLPPSEWETFIRNGEQTVKIFKGRGAINYELTTEVTLPAGRYRLQIHVYPDLVVEYLPDGSKVFADDVLSGEVRLIDGGGGTGWMLPAFGRWNRLTHDFELAAPQTIRLGVGIRGRWAIENNGWFLDQWSLRRLDAP